MKQSLSELLEHYPHLIYRQVNWGDMDAARHVNNLVYLRWSESARVDYFSSFQPGSMTPGAQKVGPILGHVDCKYIFPVTFPDTVWIGTRVLDIGVDRFRLENLIVSSRHKRVVAKVAATLLNYDYQALKKAPLPDNLSKQIQQFEASLWPEHTQKLSS